MIRIVVPGNPVAKGRPRAARVGNGVRMFTPAKTVAYEGLIALAGQEAMGRKKLLTGPLAVTVKAVFQQPKGWSKKRQLEALIMPEWHTARPDGDNILKAVGDGLNGVVWSDDSQLAVTLITKAYGPTPSLTVLVSPL